MQNPGQSVSTASANAAQQQQSNWPFLVIAVLMAVVLWLFVRTGAHPPGQRVVVSAIAVTNGATDFGVSPSRVEVRLEGTSALVERLTPDEVAVIADLAGHREGDLVPLTVVPPQGLKVLGTSVNQVRVVKLAPTAPRGPAPP